MINATIVAALLALPSVPALTAPVSESRPVGDFQSIEFRGAGQLSVAAGSAPAVTVSAEAGQVAAVRTVVRDGVLVIEQQGYPWRAGSAAVHVTVSLPTLRRLTLTGAAEAEVTGLAGGRTTLVTTGASRLTAQGAVDQLVTQFEGASRADLSRLVAGSVQLGVTGAAQVAMPARTPLAASRDSVGSLTSAERMDHRMQSTVGGSRILR